MLSFLEYSQPFSDSLGCCVYVWKILFGEDVKLIVFVRMRSLWQTPAATLAPRPPRLTPRTWERRLPGPPPQGLRSVLLCAPTMQG